MGFFSWNCKGCGESVKAPYEIPKALAWQNKMVAILPEGSVLKGDYDGYGRIDAHASSSTPKDPVTVTCTLPCWGEQQPQVWHARCHVDAGEPCEYEEPTVAECRPADQGYWYPKEGECVDLR